MQEAHAARQTGHPFLSEYRMVAKDGHDVWFRDAASVVRDDSGDPLHFQGVMLDIAEQKRVEEALWQAEKLAATGRMTARIAHEINNPLAGIKNAFMLIKDAVQPDHPYHRCVGLIDREIDRTSRIVRQMFEPFFTAKEGGQSGGLGLGLAVCKNAAELMGGSVDFASEPGEGTTFYLTLPARYQGEIDGVTPEAESSNG